jgi:hypothetical protein
LVDGDGPDIAEQVIEHQTKGLIVIGNGFTFP